MTIQLVCHYSLSSPWAYFAGPPLRWWGQDRLFFLDRTLDRLRG
jgi:2-hydroxychromene-2-carboxylate isomerase